MLLRRQEEASNNTAEEMLWGFRCFFGRTRILAPANLHFRDVLIVLPRGTFTENPHRDS
jgi:hypothetical protein